MRLVHGRVGQGHVVDEALPEGSDVAVVVAAAWWHENRLAAPELLDQELRGVIAVVVASPIRSMVRHPRLDVTRSRRGQHQ